MQPVYLGSQVDSMFVMVSSAKQSIIPAQELLFFGHNSIAEVSGGFAFPCLPLCQEPKRLLQATARIIHQVGGCVAHSAEMLNG